MRYKVYASLKEDINEGWCWITKPRLPPRSIVRIENLSTTGKVVYCEALHIDPNFVEAYSARPRTYNINLSNGKDVIVIDEWYRHRLGDLETQSEYELLIEGRNS